MKQIIQKIFILILLSVSLLSANDAKKLLSEAKQLTEVGIYKFDKVSFMKAIAICERVLSAEPDNDYALYYLTFSQYKLLNIKMAKKDDTGADELYEKAKSNAEKIAEISGFESEGNVLLAGINLYKLSTSPVLGITLAPAINSQLDDAIEINENNPRAYMLRGTMSYHTPKMFGGSIENAKDDFIKAFELYEKEDKNSLAPTWGKYETMAWLGQAYVKLDKKDKAIEIYEKAIKENPDFGWIKYKLLPAIKKSESTTTKNSTGGTLKVNFKGLNSDAGKLLISLSDSEKSHDESIPFRNAKVSIKNKSATAVFENLPFGEYSVSCFHDENNNKELDTGTFGIPKEAYGFSNDARGTFGPPSWKDAKFNFDKNTLEISIRVE